MSDHVLEAEILGGDHNGEVAFIPRLLLSPPEKSKSFSFQLKHLQFPVRLAFAISINKAQGQSVTYVGIDLHVPVFTHGQLYIALS
ncbi:helicase-like protein [Moniliophthora roreri MCA 2997]|uniref:Helicase-like protein n=1 Tax=Moniliophthora roreri (strain MCA 2997) TaxID=1381753 RepID=V2WQV3_MONRO|nr:helicase-like protein [Moniliophthora roreri MCA 2997]